MANRLTGMAYWLITQSDVRRRTAARENSIPVPPPVECGLLLFRAGLRRGLRGRLDRAVARAIDERLEVRSGTELRNRGRGHRNRVAGRGVAGRAGRPLALLEDPEASDGDLVATSHRRLDRLENGVQRLGRRL